MIKLIKIDEIPKSWTQDQIKIYEIYADLADSENKQAIGEFENIINK